MNITQKCAVDVCQREAKTRGYCSAHYERITKGSGLNPDKPLRKFSTAITDDHLREAVKTTNSWRSVLNHVGLATMSGARKMIQNRVKHLDVDTSHFPVQVPRTKCLVNKCEELSHGEDLLTPYQEEDPIKAESARIFYGKYLEAREDPDYKQLKKAWQ